MWNGMGGNLQANPRPPTGGEGRVRGGACHVGRFAPILNGICREPMHDFYSERAPLTLPSPPVGGRGNLDADNFDDRRQESFL
jgi:hypothetical protein